MTHPLTELTLAAALIVAIGAGTLAVLPEPKPAPAATKTDAERVEALQRRLIEIAAEQKRLTESVRTLARERRKR